MTSRRDTDDVTMLPVPLERDTMSFTARQMAAVQQLDKRIMDELERQSREWKLSVQRMRSQFIELVPVSDNTTLNTEQLINVQKVRSCVFEYAEGSGNERSNIRQQGSSRSKRRLQLRFNLSEFELQSVCVKVEGDEIIVSARQSTNPQQLFTRRVQKPTPVSSYHTGRHR